MNQAQYKAKGQDYYILVDQDTHEILGRRPMKFNVTLLGEMTDTAEPIHDWFELTYAQYLTIPRTVLQSMPVTWQERFVKLLEELDELIDWRPEGATYWCLLRDDETGRYINDPLADYERGRRQLAYKHDAILKRSR